MEAVVRAESWPIRGGFRISRGARRMADVVVVELRDGPSVGRGESVPYARYGESVRSVVATIEGASLSASRARADVASLPRGAARNALDCALWDLEAKRANTSVWALAELEPPEAVVTMRTVSVDDVEAMRQAARALAETRAIKVKVDGGDDLARIEAVHEAAPQAALIVDPNESWTPSQLRAWMPELRSLGVAVLEQPLPEGADEALEEIAHDVPVCADESFHDRQSFERLAGRYDMINVKLDKAGGLTEALACVDEARGRGVPFLVGCMVGTSLAIEPALLLATDADYVDLDGPLLLERDRPEARHDRTTGVLRPSSRLWGGP